ncbi:hypothetical protein JCM18750_01780 [Halostagnicola bangensis]
MNQQQLREIPDNGTPTVWKLTGSTRALEGQSMDEETAIVLAEERKLSPHETGDHAVQESGIIAV